MRPSLPVFFNLDSEIEEHPPTEQCFDFLSSVDAGSLEQRSILADHNAFLRVPFHNDTRLDLDHSVGALFEIIGHYRD